MTRSKGVQRFTIAVAAVILAGIVPGAAFAQGSRDDHQRDRRAEQRQDRDRSRNREERSQDRDNRWRRDDRRNRDDDRRDRDWDRDHDNRRDSGWDRDDRRDSERDRDYRRDRDWNARNDNRWEADEEAQHRQQTKNEWRNLAIAAGGVAAYGILKNDPTIAFAGAAGALYSLNRYEQDRKSQSSADRARYRIFSQPYIYRDGQRYERRLITKNGQRYYRFERP